MFKFRDIKYISLCDYIQDNNFFFFKYGVHEGLVLARKEWKRKQEENFTTEPLCVELH